MTVLIVTLIMVDVGALTVGLSILWKVRRIVTETAEVIQGEVAKAIDAAKADAVGKFMVAVAPALAHLSQIIPDLVSEAIGSTLSVHLGGSAELIDNSAKVRQVG